MKTFAFSVKGLLAAVTMIAVGLVALLNATSLWASIMVWLTLFLFLTALLALACRPGPGRAFWIGFAIFGWSYLLLAHIPLGASYNPFVPTHAALETLYRSVSWQVEVDHHPDMGLPPTTVVEIRRAFGGPPKVFATLPLKLYFYRIGHCVWAWLLALIGGFLARYFYLAQERKSS